ncbi:MAG: hypothetical protein KDA24_20010 [Deltaproteobacteria bacterium]|nr:hypothetical protein [Deltaproteobacteria bacterium]
MKRALLLSVAFVLLASTAWSSGPKAPRSNDVYPAQEIPLRMVHKRHLDNGLVCEVCHSTVLTSTQVSDRNLPGHQLCAACHRAELPNAHEQFPKSGCSDCHEGWTEGLPEHLGADLLPRADAPQPPPIVIPPALLTFSHQKHLDQGAVCLDCHKGVDQADRATVQHLPTMYTCLTCHDGRKAPDECTTCHLQDPGTGRQATALDGDPMAPGGRFRPDDHRDPEWLHRHEFAARADQDQCSSCHEQRQCLECHDGVQKLQRIHPGDWQMTHGLQATRRDLECKACHDSQDFCADCHDRVQTSMGQFPGQRGDPPGDARFHPPGWKGELGEIPDAEHHSFQARRSLETCQTCHQPDQCVECHSFVNPHPDSYTDAGNWRYGAGEGEVCSTCHLPGDARLEGLR